MTETTKTKTVAKASAGKASPKTPTSEKPKAASVKAAGADGTRMTELSPEAVSRRAYEIFLREGHQHGSDQDHWFRAEAELRGKTV